MLRCLIEPGIRAQAEVCDPGNLQGYPTRMTSFSTHKVSHNHVHEEANTSSI
jgi:hypothetical protein